MNKALFITLDNTLIFTKSGRKYPIHSKDWILNSDLFPAIEYFHKQKYKIIVIDNQQSVTDGYVGKVIFEEKVLEIVQTLEGITGLPENTICYDFWLGKRDKFYELPNPGMIYDFAQDYELMLGRSFMIGNSSKDKKFYNNCCGGGYIDVDDILKEEYRKWDI